GFPLGWLHGRLPFVCYVPSDSRAPGKFSEFPYLSGTEPFFYSTPHPGISPKHYIDFLPVVKKLQAMPCIDCK
ncbi:hypothetical protein, partial [Janthinobacterium sp. LB3P118]|uniref:hypothetical protein n=1 Tax=Janthinobacterium sp. LB3P118 TaxID=3424195 RepID=UPI003F26E829